MRAEWFRFVDLPNERKKKIGLAARASAFFRCLFDDDWRAAPPVKIRLTNFVIAAFCASMVASAVVVARLAACGAARKSDDAREPPSFRCPSAVGVALCIAAMMASTLALACRGRLARAWEKAAKSE